MIDFYGFMCFKNMSVSNFFIKRHSCVTQQAHICA